MNDFEKISDFAERASQNINPPVDNPILLALWHDAGGNWDAAHRIVQEISGVEAARVHAYLHRKEGDIWNADYWYRRAGMGRPLHSLADEWKELVTLHLRTD